MAATCFARAEHTENPVWKLYESKQPAICQTREDLFGRINNTSSDLLDVVVKLLNEKLDTSFTPLLGELMPWILQDICNTHEEQTRHIAVGWLGLYLYSVLIDTEADRGRSTNPDLVLAGALLLNIGLTELYTLVERKNLRKKIIYCIEHAIKSQYADIHDTTPRSDLKYKAKYAAGKNYILLALANVFAAAKRSQTNLAVPFTRDLLLPIQYLDDIGDWWEDFNTESYTVMLSRALTSQQVPSSETSHLCQDDYITVFRSLILSGALRRTLVETRNLLSKALKTGKIWDQASSHHTPSASASFFIDLYAKVEEVTLKVAAAEEDLRACSEKEVPNILDTVHKNIAIIAQSS